MLQLNQIKALLANHIPVKHFSKRSVVFDYPSFSGSGEHTLYRSHPNDEVGEDWDVVDDEYFQASQYAVNRLCWQGNVFEVMPEDHRHDMTKVVKFKDPKPVPANHHEKFTLVLVYLYQVEDPDEVATEAAIEELMKRGWSATEAQALLVI